jgi:phage terminase large subunit
LADCPHISQARIDDVIATYGSEAEFTKSTLYGEFMNQEESGQFAFSFEAVSQLVAQPPHARISKLEYSAFCDFAAGRDENVLAIRSGNKLIELEAWKDKNTVAAVGRFIMLFRRFGLKASQIWGDNGGIGHSMIDMLNDAGWSINRFDFGAPANRKDAFVSRGAEIWLGLSRQVIKQEVCLINDPTLISQLVTRRVAFDGRGRIKLETKEELDARGLRSPDRADAVIGAFAHGSPNYLTYAQMPMNPWEQMDELPDSGDLLHDRNMQQKLGAWCGE